MFPGAGTISASNVTISDLRLDGSTNHTAYPCTIPMPGMPKGEPVCEKTPSFEPSYTKNDHFAKTCSGQTYGKVEKKAFCAGVRAQLSHLLLHESTWRAAGYHRAAVWNCVFVKPFYTKSRAFAKTGPGQT
jgi:hypothetical protein